jgi:hypothetical protein
LHSCCEHFWIIFDSGLMRGRKKFRNFNASPRQNGITPRQFHEISCPLDLFIVLPAPHELARCETDQEEQQQNIAAEAVSVVKYEFPHFVLSN